jgi:hypothetical protein
MVTLAAQIGITLMTQGKDGGTFGIIVIMNVAFSGIMLLTKGFDMFLKWGLLRGASKDEDCEAAQKAWKKIQKERARSSIVGSGRDGDAMEIGTLYGDATDGDCGPPTRDSFVDNPMMTMSPLAFPTSAVPGETEDKRSEREALLARFPTRDEMRESIGGVREEVLEEVRRVERRVTGALAGDDDGQSSKLEKDKDKKKRKSSRSDRSSAVATPSPPATEL